MSLPGPSTPRILHNLPLVCLNFLCRLVFISHIFVWWYSNRLFSSLSSILDKCVIQTVNPLAAIITVSINKSKWDKISWCSTQTHWCSVMMTQLWQLTIAIFYYKYKSVPMTKHRHRYHLYCDVELNLELLWAVTLFYNHIVVYSYCFMAMPMIFYSFASRFMPPFKLQSVCQRF